MIMKKGLQLAYMLTMSCALTLGVLLPQTATAQRIVAADTLFGHEWINAGSTYLRLAVTEEGVYRLTQPQLAAAGFTNVTGSALELMHYGEEVPLFVTTDGAFGVADYIEFAHDAKASMAYEAELFPGASTDNMLSPRYRIFGDSVAYFMRADASGIRQRLRPAAVDVVPSSAAAKTLQREALAHGAREFGKVIYDSEGSKYSTFQIGEGWGVRGQRVALSVATPGRIVGAPATLELRTLSSYASEHVRSIQLGQREVLREASGRNAFRINFLPLTDADFVNGELPVVVAGEVGVSDIYFVGDVAVGYAARAGFGESQNYSASAGPALSASGALTIYADGNPGQFRLLHPARQ